MVEILTNITMIAIFVIPLLIIIGIISKIVKHRRRKKMEKLIINELEEKKRLEKLLAEKLKEE